MCHSPREVVRYILASTFTAFLAIKSHSCCISNERCCFKDAAVAICRNVLPSNDDYCYPRLEKHLEFHRDDPKVLSPGCSVYHEIVGW